LDIIRSHQLFSQLAGVLRDLWKINHEKEKAHDAMVGLLAGFDVIILKSALLKAGLTRLFSQLTRLLRESVGNKDKAV